MSKEEAKEILKNVQIIGIKSETENNITIEQVNEAIKVLL